MSPGNLRASILVFLLLAIVVYAGISAYGDFARLGDALASFRWRLLPAILSLTLFNYALRFAKWEYYLRLIGVRRRRHAAAGPSDTAAPEPRARELTLGESVSIFLSGLFMVITPGKVGEWIKSYLLLRTVGTAPGRSAPIVVAERATDGLALALLALAGLFSVRQGWLAIFAVVVLIGGLVALLRYGPLARWGLRRLGTLPVLRRYSAFLRQFYESSETLFSARSLVLATLLGTVSWLGEGAAAYLVYLGLGVEGGAMVFIRALFILALSTLVGALLALPGGLGATDFTIAALSQALFGLARGPAAAAALIIRVATLWLGVSVGAVALVLVSRRLGGFRSIAQEGVGQGAGAGGAVPR